MRLHPKTRDLMAKMGTDIRTWRRAQGLTAAGVADRAGISRMTLHNLETNPGSVQFENLLAVLAVLGLDEAVGAAIDPTQSVRGQTLLAAAVNRKRRP